MKVFLSLIALMLLFTDNVAAELLPENVLVIANSNDKESIEIADYYAERRRVPKKNIVKIPLSSSEIISREKFKKKLVNPLRLALEKRKISSTIKAFVSIKGVPLKIEEAKNSESELRNIELAKNKLLYSDQEIAKIVSSIQKSLGEKETGLAEIKKEDFPKRFKNLIKRAGQAAKKTKDTADEKQLAETMRQMGGLNALMGIMVASGEGEALEDSKKKIEGLKKELKESFELQFGLRRVPSAKNTERMYVVTQKTLGLLGVRTLAIKEMAKSSVKESSASVDSELSLLWWDRGSYPIAGRLPNPLYFKLKGKQMHLPVLMQSRLDGPDKNRILTTIDETIETETNGLDGEIYIDTRGLKFKRNDTFSKYDQSLNDLGWLIRDKSKYKVSMDTSPQLFESAKNVALYVGWYRLRDYQDVFTFKPGALAWHIASEEAVSIREPQEKGWCKNFLERGVAATIGATQEPYLESFPEPLVFFGLLFTGQYSLAEAYFLTSPNLSWRTVLFGDPLYNPWRGRGFVSIKDLKMKNLQGQDITTFIEAPSEKSFKDPAEVIKEIKSQNKQIDKKLDKIFM